MSKHRSEFDEMAEALYLAGQFFSRWRPYAKSADIDIEKRPCTNKERDWVAATGRPTTWASLMRNYPGIKRNDPLHCLAQALDCYYSRLNTAECRIDYLSRQVEKLHAEESVRRAKEKEREPK